MIQKENVFYGCGTPIVIAENAKGETHVYRAEDRVQLSETDLKGGVVFGGCPGGECDFTDVTMESGLLSRLYGGSDGGTVRGSACVTMTGGVITEDICGAGVNDTVDNVTVTVSGGAIKNRCIGGGKALSCGDITLNFPHIVCCDVFTGVCNEQGIHTGSAKMRMEDGVVLNLHCGGEAVTEGSAEITVSGGFLEKQVIPYEVKGGITLRLYKEIRQSGGYDIVFPIIPEELSVEWLTEGNGCREMRRYKEVQDGFFDQTEEAGRLVLRFFEIRDPEVPKYTARFPQFIGDCILISFPNGKHMLIDTGMPYAAKEITDGLKRLGIRRLDYLQITHLHADHMGCATELLRQFPVDLLILPKVHSILLRDTDYVMYTDMLEAAEEFHVPLRRVMKGDRLTVGSAEQETLVEFLNPKNEWETTDNLNYASIATKISFREASVVLGGDITNSIEQSLAAEYADQLSCDLLKLSHHGIIQQSHYAYIDACSPQYVVVHNLREDGIFISATRYQLNHIHRIPDDRIFVTGICGRIKATLTGKKNDVRIQTQYTD